MPVLAQTHAPLEHRDGPLHLPLALMHSTDPLARHNQAEGIIDGLGDPEPFFGHGAPLRERTTFSMAEAQAGPGDDRDAARCAKAFIAQISLEGRHIPLQTLDGPRIVSRVV